MASHNDSTIISITTPSQLSSSFKTYQQLRPHLVNEQEFIQQILSQQSNEGFKLSGISSPMQEDSTSEISTSTNNESQIFIALVGFRIMTTTAWGKIVYIDDLITSEEYRGCGHGSKLLNHVFDYARENGCKQVHLDSGYQRNAAHKVYLNHGFTLASHHFSKVL